LTALLGAAGIDAPLHGSVLVALDKLDKVGPDGVAAELAERGVGSDARTKVLSFFQAAASESGAGLGDDPYTELERLEGRVADQELGRAACDNLRGILSLTEGTRAAKRMRLDPSLARGLSYYTGAIMEVNVADLAGSLGGGGRYDNLVGMFSGQEIPACGFSLGLERILVVMSERRMFPPTLISAPADVLVAMFSAAGAADAIRVADQLRASGLRVFVYPDADKIGKQIKYADAQHIPYVAIVGDEEIEAGTVTVKDLAAQTQQTYPQSAAGPTIAEALTRRG
jgi:histidyl-tRNA synthetase